MKKAFIYLLLCLCINYSIELSAYQTEGYQWDFKTLYISHEAWQSDYDRIEVLLEKSDQFKNSVTDNATQLKKALDFHYHIRSSISRLVMYGQLNSIINSASDTAQIFQNKALQLEARAISKLGYISEEISNASSTLIRNWLKNNHELSIHRRQINRILWEKPYSVPPLANSILQNFDDKSQQLTYRTYTQLINSDLGWPSIEIEDGETVSTGFGIYSRYLGQSGQTTDRSKVIYSFLESAGEKGALFSNLLTRRIEFDLLIARNQNFNSGINALWYLRDGMPVDSYKTMIDVTKKNSSTLSRYITLRSEALNLSEIKYEDLYSRLPEYDQDFEIEKALEIAVNAFEPLGNSYQERLLKRLNEPWFQFDITPNQRGVYGIYPAVGGGAPHMLLQYLPEYRRARALTGGLAMVMTFADIPIHLQSPTRDDPGIYANAMIYTGHLLHDRYLFEDAESKDAKVIYLLNALETIWSNYFQWVIVTELEMKLEEIVASGRLPSHTEISNMYLGLLNEYYNGEGEKVSIHPSFAHQWVTFRVPFLSYEHQFWPPAMATAVKLTDLMFKGNERGTRGMTSLLGRGDLDLTHSLLLQVDIDMNSSEPYEAVIIRMNELMDELEVLLKAE